MKGYGQFCPVAQALEILGERWTLLLVRELLEGSTRFVDLQKGLPLMSRSVLAQRLRSLCDAGVVSRSGTSYGLTDAGRELAPIVIACGNWGARWARRKLKSDDVDVGLLMWDIRRRVRLEAIPFEHVLVQMDFRGAPRGKDRFYLHFKQKEVELCLTNPGLPVALHLTTTPKTMAEIWLGIVSFRDAMAAGSFRIEGPAKLARAFPSWLALSVFAKGRAPAATTARALR